MEITKAWVNELLSAYPGELSKLLERQTNLQIQIAREQRLLPEDDEFQNYAFSAQKDLARAETAIDKMEAKLKEAEGRAETTHRQSVARPTEASSRAWINCDEVVISLRLSLADLVEKRALAKIKVQEQAMEERKMPAKPPTTQLQKLQEELAHCESRIGYLNDILPVYQVMIQFIAAQERY